LFDRHLLDDYIFSTLPTVLNSISYSQQLHYKVIHDNLLEKINKIDAQPDYFILLKAPLVDVVERLNIRARDEEDAVDIEY
jgi:deoxyadenosine/deoxycytidine kinase